MKNFSFFFFLLFSILPLLVIEKITTILFFRNSDFKCPKMALSALKFQFYKLPFFPNDKKCSKRLPKGQKKLFFF